MARIIGTDCGGTFTEAVVLDESGEIVWGKAPTTPSDFSIGIREAIDLVATKLRISTRELLKTTNLFVNGTTIAINSLVLRQGAKTGLITTKGHEDAILIGRAKQKAAGLPTYELFNLAKLDKPVPIVPRDLIRGITERVDSQGAEVLPLEVAEVERAADYFKQVGVEAVAISFLWSFLDPSHEKKAQEIIARKYPEFFLTTSSDLVPVIKEYERTTTTVINSYLSKKVSNYTKSITDLLRSLDFSGTLLIMQSSGGSMPFDEAPKKAVSLLVSGLAGGVFGAKALGESLGFKDIITCDMGGTSFESSLIQGGQPLLSDDPVFSQYSVIIPVIDIAPIGAGGGSIAWIDHSTGGLKVGPQSAQAVPGPVCYQRGGTEPTVTDADLIMNRLNPDYFLGGRLKLDRNLAVEAIKEKIAEPLKIDVFEAAAAICEVIDAKMAEEVRRVIVTKGLDPRDFTMFAFGGAGPTHVGNFARDVDVKEVVIPFCSSAFSAFGVGISDVIHIAEVSKPMRSPFDGRKIEEIFEELQSKAQGILQGEGFPDDALSFRRFVKMKYGGQVHELTIPFEGSSRIPAKEGIEDLIKAFEINYESRYGVGTAYRQAGVEILSFQLHAVGKTKKPILKERPLFSKNPPASSIKPDREVYWTEYRGRKLTPVYSREALMPGNEIPGPTLIEGMDSTIVIHPGERARVDGLSNVRLAFKEL